MEIQLTVTKNKVFDEVAKTTSYVGHKMPLAEGTDPYTTIFTTDEDKMMLERFFNEAANSATDAMKEYILEVTTYDQPQGTEPLRNYEVTLRMTDNWDARLASSMESSLFSYFVDSICAKWFVITNKSEAEAYTTKATGHMDDLISKFYHRVRPQRPNDRPAIGLGLSHH